MTPTNELRWIERTVSELKLLPNGYEDFVDRTVHILQQKWENPYVGESEEWRDVPVEKEPKP